MKTEIEIVTGFLGSGKTLFIDSLLKNTLVSGETVLIIQCEQGEQKINLKKYSKGKVIIKEYNPSESLNSAYIEQMIDFYKPHRIVIEHNGMQMLNETLNMFEEKRLSTMCREPILYYLADALTFDIFISNMKELVEPCAYHSNLIVINNCSMINGEKKKALLKQLESLNSRAIIIPLDNLIELDSRLNKADVFDNGLLKNLIVSFQNIKFQKSNRRR